jgi:DNA-binding response OmpR family regulator
MTRILLAIEDYNELIFFETLLKKVGFDVVGVQNDIVISEKLMSFNPELMIVTSQGTRVNGAKAMARLKSKGNLPRTIFVNPRGKKTISPDKAVVAILDSPVSPRSLIELVASLLNLDEDLLMEKYEKARGIDLDKEGDILVQDKGYEIEAADSIVKFKERVFKSEEKNRKRVQGYKQVAEQTKLPPYQGPKKALVIEQVKDFRKEEKEGLYTSIDEERIAFAKALTRKYPMKKK